jgi:hypothetical protein
VLFPQIRRTTNNDANGQSNHQNHVVQLQQQICHNPEGSASKAAICKGPTLENAKNNLPP